MNKLESDDIILDIENHEYKLKKNPDMSFTSVTTFINSFFEPFDDIKISNYLSLWLYISMYVQQLSTYTNKISMFRYI